MLAPRKRWASGQYRVVTAPMVDSFADPRRPGRVVGTSNPAGVLRRGRDVERQIAIDNGALRLQPLVKPGWGRQGVVYGPYRRVAGLTFAVSITNGHNTSQSGRLPDSFKHRLWRWVVGSQSEAPLKRLLSWARQQAEERDASPAPLVAGERSQQPGPEREFGARLVSQ